MNLLDTAMADPWGTLRTVLGEPLHPGGAAATERLLDRAGVDATTRLLDIGCGGGESLALASGRGADAVGLDRDPSDPHSVRGDLRSLPFTSESVDVVLAECVLCLSDLSLGLREARRVLSPGGRLALSDVVVDGPVPDVPPGMAEALCLTGQRDRDTFLASIETAGFSIASVESHRDDLLSMRDRARNRVDYAGLLGLFGDRGRRLVDGIEATEAAIEDGRIGYVSVVSTAD